MQMVDFTWIAHDNQVVLCCCNAWQVESCYVAFSIYVQIMVPWQDIGIDQFRFRLIYKLR